MEDIKDLLAPGTIFSADGVEYESKGVEIDGGDIIIKAEVKGGAKHDKC